MNRLTALIIASLLSALTATAQAEAIITTFAGGGPNNIPALEASLDRPTGLTFDVAGNLFITSSRGNRVFKVDPTGTLTVAAGNGTWFGSLHNQFLDNGPATAATFFHPQAAAFDVAGNLFIADSTNLRIRRIDAVTGIITTVAGSGTIFYPGFGGDGGPATQALLNGPSSLAFDTAGNLYFSDSSNHRIRKIAVDADGRIDGDLGEIITTVAGNGSYGFGGDDGPASQAILASPAALTIDASGSLYFVDNGNRRIRRITGGIITTVVGNGSSGFSPDGTQGTAASLNYPGTLAVDAWGNLFFPDQYRVRRVNAGPDGVVTGNDPAETLVTVAGNGTSGSGGDGGPATSASTLQPTAVAFDANGNLYVADWFYVRRVAAGANGKIDGSSDPAEIITRVAGNGFDTFSGDGFPAPRARLYTPYGLAFDAPRQLFYIADMNNHRVRRVDAATGTITTVAGNGLIGFSGDNGPATEARLNAPLFVTVDAHGNLFIADYENHRIRRVDTVTGTISTVAGNGVAGFDGDEGLATGASLNRPTGIAVDAHGNLFIADDSNHRIRRVAPGADGLVTGDDPGEIITTVVGTGPTGSNAGSFGGDGGAGSLANLNSPKGVTVDSAGNLFIADQINKRVRRVEAGADGQVIGAPDEIITTVVGGGTGGFNGPATAANFPGPWATVLDASGTLFISNAAFETVARVDAGGDGQVTGAANEIITLVAGGCCFNGDNIPAASASLKTAAQLAIDSSGDLYIADAGNDRIRKVNFSNTPTGSNVEVTIPPVTVTFATVTSSGNTTVTSSGTGKPLPQGFKLGNPPVYYMVETTAAYSGAIRICIDYSGVSYGNVNQLRLFHQTDTGWEDATAAGYPDTANHVICGTVSTLSVFAVFEADYTFNGFLPPLGNPPVLNTAKAGQTVPIKWQLIDGSGLYLGDLGAVTGLRYQPATCDGMLENSPADADISGSSGLRYDITSNQFVFTWKTDKSMAGSCYHFILELYGFDRHQADIKLK